MTRTMRPPTPVPSPNPSIGRNTKYASKNPISRHLIDGYFKTLAGLLEHTPASVLEIGCGEGVLLHRLGGPLEGCRTTALDIDRPDLRVAKENLPATGIVQGSSYHLPFLDGQFELVICCEVLEHMEAPEAALAEIARVGAERFLFSVPNEPLWRMLNMARGAYLSRCGNTPGHINRWSARGFRALLESFFRIERFAKPLPWLMAECRKA